MEGAMTNEHVRALISDALINEAPPHLKGEVTDAQWADYGRMVHSRLTNTNDMITALNRASLRSKTAIEMVGYIRAFILTGTKP
jgi:hypothetical protein